ncbi:replicative DNA helicase [Streptomyces sp. NPDC049577]|uniref:replicative DNA helicase n=1 Tax=Streptomyces sp. NPDC049577 TaxID=3155153 RepID=UPI00342CAB80
MRRPNMPMIPDARMTDDREAVPAGGDFGRVPPNDRDAEQAGLGGMLMAKSAIGEAVEIIKNGADFYYPAHETIFNTIVDMYVAGQPADPITVAAELKKRGDLARVGGAAYLHHLVQQCPSWADVPYYAEIIHEKAVLRRLAEAGTRIAASAYAAEGDATDLVDAAGAEITGIAGDRTDDESADIGDDDDAFMDELEAFQKHGRADGVPTGFTDLDNLTGGLHGGQMIIVAARPAIGKSTLAIDFVRAAAIKNGKHVLFFSLEMSRTEIKQRIYSAQAKVALHHLRTKGGMTDDDWDRIRDKSPEINAAPIHLDTDPNRTVMQIKAKARRRQQRHGLDLIVIDYLQLIQSSGRRAENRQVEVSQMSRDLKLLAKELNVPVVVLAQLNRGPEQRTDKKPMKSDLRESGALEQDADIVILLHRDDAYEKESPRAGEADLIVDKHRNGPTATVTVAFQGHYSRFVDMAHD